MTIFRLNKYITLFTYVYLRILFLFKFSLF